MRKAREVPVYRHHRMRQNTDKLNDAFNADVQKSIMSSDQQAAYATAMGAVARPTGGFTGCGYMGYNDGISCQYGSIGHFHPNMESFFSTWVANVDYPYGPDFPQPRIFAPGNINQILAGGNSGNNPCIEACSCQNDPHCTCRDAVDVNGQPIQCGWPSINHDCMEPVPGGKYKSLSACEAAQSLGFYGK
jgi:hypothetical protein